MITVSSNRHGFLPFVLCIHLPSHLSSSLSMANPNLSYSDNIICDGSPSRIRSVRRISFGMTTLPKSSILLTMPVALICLSSSVSNLRWSVVQSYYEPKDAHLCKNTISFRRWRFFPFDASFQKTPRESLL